MGNEILGGAAEPVMIRLLLVTKGLDNDKGLAIESGLAMERGVDLSLTWGALPLGVLCFASWLKGEFSLNFERKKGILVEDECRIPPLPRSFVIVLTLIFRCSPPQSRVTISKTTAVDD